MKAFRESWVFPNDVRQSKVAPAPARGGAATKRENRSFQSELAVPLPTHGRTQTQANPSAEIVPAGFGDVSESSGVHFEHRAPHSSRKYLLEAMGSGTALFDYNNNGRLSRRSSSLCDM